MEKVQFGDTMFKLAKNQSLFFFENPNDEVFEVIFVSAQLSTEQH